MILAVPPHWLPALVHRQPSLYEPHNLYLSEEDKRGKGEEEEKEKERQEVGKRE